MTQESLHGPLRRRASGKRLSFANGTVLFTSIASGMMLGVAMPHLVGGSGLWLAAKCALVAGSAAIISYSVNRLAVDRGAPLTAIGYPLAGVVSVLSIAVIGGGLFTATYSGLVFDDVEQLSIEAHGTVLNQYVAERSKAASEAGRIVPAMAAIAADLAQKRTCEIASSCVSGSPRAGRGPVARALDEKSGRAQAILAEIERGTASRDAALGRINQRLGEYQAVAGSDALDIGEKRRRLQAIDAAIRQTVAELDEAFPVALLRAYEHELTASSPALDDPDAARAVTALLQTHGQALGDVLQTMPGAAAAAPAFPRPTGVSDTFGYISHFLPIAAVTAVVELVFPISLWLYTLFALNWAAYRISPPEPRAPHEDDEAIRWLLPGPDALRERLKRASERGMGNGDPDPGDSNPGDSAPTRRGPGRPRSSTNGDARGHDR